MIDDLKWCFDIPAQVVIELALLRLAVPGFYHNMLDDIDGHATKTTITAAGITADLLKNVLEGGIHRQKHGTGQGTIDGPQKWIAVADMVISVARAASTAPVTLPVDATRAVCLDRTWFVDDSGLFPWFVPTWSSRTTGGANSRQRDRAYPKTVPCFSHAVLSSCCSRSYLIASDGARR